MRVLHLVPALFDPDDGVLGGAERYALELARHMAGQVPTRLVTFGSTHRQDQRGPLAIRVIGHPWHVRGERTNPVSLSLVREISWASVVHCHQQHVVASSLAAVICRLTGKRAFVTELGGGGWDVSAYVSTDAWYEGHLHLSNYSRTQAGHAHRAWAHVIFGGVDTTRFSPAAPPVRGNTILFVGRLLPHKGLEDLIKAIPDGMALEVIGRPYDSAYADRLRGLGNSMPVRWRHDCNDDMLVEAYRGARCVVLPSVYRTPDGRETRVPELLGQTLLEAMACGTPVLCTNVGSLPEVVEDGLTGFVVPPNTPAALRERLTWFKDHPAQADEMGRAGRKRVLEQFTWPLTVGRCLEIYDRSRPRP